MRTALDIDDDVLAAAKELARTQRTSAGRIVSQLLRQPLAGRVPTENLESAGVGEFRPFAARD